MTLLTPLERPPRLVPGDRVAVVSPSGVVAADRLERGVATLRSWGLSVVVGEHVLAVRRHLAGTDEQRAADLQQAWCDPATRAVICARGGSGAARVVDLLDWSAMAAAGPRALVGFSDVTALHQAVANRLGLATLYGPMTAAGSFAGAADSDSPADQVTIDGLRRVLFQPESCLPLADGGLRCEVGGRASGVLVGGTLALLATSVGTPDERRAAGGIAVLEDVAEPTYRVDAMLTQLLRSGWFDDVAGVVLGTWVGCGADLVEVVVERLATLGVPIASGLPFGHGVPQLTVPLGDEAHLDADAGTLTLRHPALL